MRKFMLVLCFFLMSAPILAAQNLHVTPTTVDGNMALRFRDDINFFPRTATVVRQGPPSDPVFVIPFNRPHGLLQYAFGHLRISSKSIHWQTKNGKESFDEPFSAFRVAGKYSIVHVTHNGQDEKFYTASDNGGSSVSNKALNAFLQKIADNFASANTSFLQMHGGNGSQAEQTAQVKPVEQAPVDPFHEQAAAWRALSVKPKLPEEARKQSFLAESYVREKDFPRAIRHYELGLKLYPTWPEGWFNLGLLYAETNDYKDAIDRMNHYLELSPDAPDASAVRDKITFWEDKIVQRVRPSR